MFRAVIAVVVAFFGAAHIIQKKDRVILELQSDITRLNSYDHVRSIFRDGFRAGYEQGWMDRSTGAKYNPPKD